MSATEKHLYEFGSFRLDTREHLLLRNGQRVKLEGKVFETLVALVQRSGRLVRKDELMNEVWPDAIVEENNLEKSVSALRKALGEDGADLRYIETVRGLGYRFVADVRESGGEVSTLIRHESRTSLTVEDEEFDLAETGGVPVQRRSISESTALSARTYSLSKSVNMRRSVFLVAAVVLVLAIATTVYFYFVNRPNATVNSMAVMPFANVGEDPNTEYLSDGITESLINNLSQLPKMKMIAGTSVFPYKGKDWNPQTVGRELNVQAILTGRIVQRGDRLSISAELMDVKSNTHLWGEQYERKVSDLLAVQREIASEIASKLRVKLSSEEQSRVTKLYTANAEAYQLYLKGRFYSNKRTSEAVSKSIDYFKQAIAVDSSYALAYAGLADSYIVQGSLFGSRPPKEIYPEAKDAAIKALEIDNGLAEAHTSLATVRMQYDWNWTDAESEFKKAIALTPNYPTAHHWYAFFLAGRRRFDEAVAEIRSAQDLDPVSLIVTTDVGAILFLAGRYDEAIDQCRKALELDANFAQAHNILGLIYERQGKYDQWLAEYEKVLTLSGRSDQAATVGRIYAKSGYQGVLENRLAELKERATSHYVPAFAMAVAYADSGDKDHAFEWLEKAFEERSPRMADLEVMPALQSLRSDRRFTDLVQRLGS